MAIIPVIKQDLLPKNTSSKLLTIESDGLWNFQLGSTKLAQFKAKMNKWKVFFCMYFEN